MMRRSVNQEESHANASWNSVDGLDQQIEEYVQRKQSPSGAATNDLKKELSSSSLPTNKVSLEGLMSDLKSPQFCGKMDGPSHDHLKNEDWVRLPSRGESEDSWRRRVPSVPYQHQEITNSQMITATGEDGSNISNGSRKKQRRVANDNEEQESSSNNSDEVAATADVSLQVDLTLSDPSQALKMTAATALAPHKQTES